MTTSQDILLLLQLIRAARKVDGRKRLQKMVCIAKTRDEIPFTFHFKPYFYGPYSEELADAVAALRGVGIVEEERIRHPDGIIQYSYYLSEKGEEFVKGLISKRAKKTVAKLVNEVAAMNSLETHELVTLAKQLPFN